NGPLSFMTNVSPGVYLYRPNANANANANASANANATTSTPTPTPDPKLILLASWMGAREMHIAKYVRPYQALYPTSPILVIRAEVAHVFFQPAAIARVAPALPIIREIVGVQHDNNDEKDVVSTKTNKTKMPQILVHLFSNGGSATIHTLSSLYTSAYGLPLPKSSKSSSTSIRFPPHVIIFDSAPAWTYSYTRLLAALTTGMSRLTRLLFSPLTHALCVLFWFLHLGFLQTWFPGPMVKVAGRHNTRGKGGVAVTRAASELRRTYIYSDGDKLVDWDDVEKHARIAEAKGFEVRLERFDGTQHVAHVRGGEERYWKAVRETWEG
ncbi:hypothetical protein B0T17DRAFT_472033, partial [Bombardia bombarda]